MAKPSSREWRSWSFWWWQEVLGVVGSLACMVTVSIILVKMQNQPDTHWTFPISLNATIAAIITAGKSSAIMTVAACISQCKWIHYQSKKRKLEDFDTIEEAARGPYGAVLLLAKIPWSGLATVGALITIIALGIDTFAQQVMKTKVTTKWVDDGSAVLSIANSYFTTAKVAASGSIWVPDPFTVDTPMQGAIYRGFYNLESQLLFNCTSNCTWNDSYISLGFVSECRDVTQATNATRVCSQGWGELEGNCNMTTPGNITFNIAMNPTSWTTVLVVKAASLYDQDEFGDVGLPNDDLPATFIRVAFFSQPSEYRIYNESYIDQNQQTLECDISLAAYNYSIASSNGTDFAIQSTQTMPLNNGYINGYYSTNESLLSINFNTTGLPEFQVSTLDLGVLLSFFPSDSFSGTLLDGEEPMPKYAQGITAAMPNPDRNISALMDSMATSMTNQLRLVANTTSAARGLTAQAIVIIQVQWAWLALPFAVSGTSLFLLLALIVESTRSRSTKLWKSTATALLYHTISGTRLDGSLDSLIANPEQLRCLVEESIVTLGSPKQRSEALRPLLKRSKD